MNLKVFDAHDGKMMHNLTQHSQWSRKHHPYLWCKCMKGESVMKLETHKCKILSDDEMEVLCDKSAKRFDAKFNDESNEETHRNWCDEHNFGVTHFGMHP